MPSVPETEKDLQIFIILWPVGQSDVGRSDREGDIQHLQEGDPGHHAGQAKQNPRLGALRPRRS